MLKSGKFWWGPGKFGWGSFDLRGLPVSSYRKKYVMYTKYVYIGDMGQNLDPVIKINNTCEGKVAIARLKTG